MSRVKSLSKSGNPRKDQAPTPVSQINKEVSSAPSLPASSGMEDGNYQRQEMRPIDISRKPIEKENLLYSSAADIDKPPSSFSSSYLSNGREEKGFASASMDRDKSEVKNSYSESTSQKMNSYSQNSVDADEKVQKVSPPRRKGYKDEKPERSSNWLKRDASGSDLATMNSKQQTTGNYNTTATGSRQYQTDPCPDGNISAILEVVQICEHNFL